MTDAWPPPDSVRDWMQLDGSTGSDLPAPVEAARQAAADYIHTVRPDLFPDDNAAPTGAPLTAALIATKRLAARATGSGFAEFGATVAFLELDPDVSTLLGLGNHATPGLG